MVKVSKSQRYEIDAQEMWLRIGDFQALHTWHPAIISCESAADGKVRRLTTDGGTAIETLLDEAPLGYGYRIDESPLPVKNYISNLRVHQDRPGACVVEWEAEFVPAGVPEDEACAIVDGILQAGLDNL